MLLAVELSDWQVEIHYILFSIFVHLKISIIKTLDNRTAEFSTKLVMGRAVTQGCLQQRLTGYLVENQSKSKAIKNPCWTQQMSPTQLSYTKKSIPTLPFFPTNTDCQRCASQWCFQNIFKHLYYVITMNEKGTVLWKKPKLVLFGNVSTVVGFCYQKQYQSVTYKSSYIWTPKNLHNTIF